MESNNRSGRTFGILMLAQMAAALIVPFLLIDPLRSGYPGFLTNAGASGFRIRAGVAVAFLGSALTALLGIKLFPILRRYSFELAAAFFAACVISAALDMVHYAAVLSMLSAVEHSSAADIADASVINGWAAAAGYFRRTVHIVQLGGFAAWMTTFYFSTGKYRIIPRPLSILGLIGVAGQFAGVTVMMFLGYSPITYFAMPLAPILVITALWIIFKGFPKPPNNERIYEHS